MVDPKNEAESRRFYQIHEQIFLEYRVLSLDGGTASRDDDPSLLASQLQAQLNLLDEKNARLLHQVTLSHPAVAEYFRLMQKKLELVVDFISNDLIGRVLTRGEQKSLQWVDLSVGNISFTREQPLDVGTSLELKITLLPKHENILAKGDIAECTELEGAPGRYQLRVQFTSLTEAQEQVILRHIFQKQLEERRNQNVDE